MVTDIRPRLEPNTSRIHVQCGTAAPDISIVMRCWYRLSPLGGYSPLRIQVSQAGPDRDILWAGGFCRVYVSQLPDGSVYVTGLCICLSRGV
jgi:hypothetical protein